jgi:DNA-binding LacI/PurR family transcriptional regulator
VAAAAGVSTATVSLVFNGKGRVAEETRQRVLETGKRLGYRPNPLGRALQSGRSHVIGVVVSYRESAVWERTYLPYYRNVIAGAAIEAVQHGYSIAAVPGSTDGEVQTQVPLDGVVVVDPVPGDPLLDYCLERFRAVVTDGRHYRHDARERPLSVRGDIERGIPAMLDHLRDQHRVRHGDRIFAPALLLGQRMDSYSTDTLDSFTAWCEAHGADATVARSAPDASPVDSATALLGSGTVNAVHALNETYCSAVLTAAERLGIDVPETLQLSVGGNAATIDAEKRAAYLSMDPAESGAACARTLIARLEGDVADDVVLPYRVVPAGTPSVEG